MADRVKPLKLESPDTGGTQLDEFPTSLDANEDLVDARGVTLQNDTSDDEQVVISRDAADNLTFVDAHMSVRTLTDLASGSGMTPADHRALDQLVHELDENFYEEYTYSGWRVTGVVVWDSTSKIRKIREHQYTYSGLRVSQELIIQYDQLGTEVERMTYNYSYTGRLLTSVSAAYS